MSENIKSGSTSPMKSARKAPNVTYASRHARPATPLQSVEGPPRISITLVRGSHNRSNTGLTGERAPVQKNDIQIYHESKVMKSLENLKKEHNKRNPILQDNEEPIQEFRPTKRPASAERNSGPKEDVFLLSNVKAKKHGEFNHEYNPRTEEVKPQGIRAFVVLPPQSRDENPRRISKGVRHKSEIRQRNPLTEGDPEGVVIKRGKKPGPPVDEHQKLNEKRFMLPAERGASPNGRVFRESTFTIGESVDFSSLGSQSERYASRPLTPLEMKMRGQIKGVLEYDSGPKYRDQKVSDKCNTIKFKDILKAQEESLAVFRKKKTLEYL